jgi:hypothetical protein
MSIPFASHPSNSETIPFEPDLPNTITVRRLTGGEEEQAQAEHLKGLGNGRSSRGWSKAFQRILNKANPSEQDAAEVLADPLNGYDRLTVAKAGLIGWSYPPADPKQKRTKPSDKEVEDLVDEALEFVALAVMRKTKPELFQPEDERKAAQKNG